MAKDKCCRYLPIMDWIEMDCYLLHALQLVIVNYQNCNFPDSQLRSLSIYIYINFYYYDTFSKYKLTPLMAGIEEDGRALYIPINVRITSYIVDGNIEVFANNTDSSESARNELSHLESALFAFKL